VQRTLEKVDFARSPSKTVTLELNIYTGYDLANETAYLDDTLRWGLNWLIKVSSTVPLSGFRTAE
jgi:hypothetical protein